VKHPTTQITLSLMSRVFGLLLLGGLAVASRTMVPPLHAKAGNCIQCAYNQAQGVAWCQTSSRGANTCWNPTRSTCQSQGSCS